MFNKNVISISKKVINLYISYTLYPQLRNLNKDFTLGNCLFGLEFSFTDGSFGRNVIIFGADMSSSVHIDHKGKDILILSEGRTQGLDHTILTAEAKYPINFTQTGKRLLLSLHYNGSNSYKILQNINSKQKTLK